MGLVTAYDANNDPFIFQLPLAFPASPFVISPQGTLTLVGALRWDQQSLYSLVVTVTETQGGHACGLSSAGVVTVRVVDVADTVAVPVLMDMGVVPTECPGIGCNVTLTGLNLATCEALVQGALGPVALTPSVANSTRMTVSAGSHGRVAYARQCVQLKPPNEGCYA